MVGTMKNVVENAICLACGSHHLKTALDLGNQALANSFLSSPKDPEQTYPLAVRLCHHCFHLQLSHSVSPEIIYKNYLYATGTNTTIQNFSKWFATWVDEYTNSRSDTVLDIGCNDGTQLNYFSDMGYNTFGIDPAKNLYARSSLRHQVICDFFSETSAQELAKNSYDVVIAQNVFAHNPDPLSFMNSCKLLMNDDTLLFIQTSQANMVINNEFDTIYHEHINFFNVNSMNKLSERAGINLIDVVKTPIHGTSYIFVLSKTLSRPRHIANIIALEQAQNLLTEKRYTVWANTVRENVHELNSTINVYRALGYTIVGYGAAAKGNTLLNFGKIELDYIIDDSPLKQGKYTPGQHIPVTNIERLEDESEIKIMFVPLAWNFFDEIKNRIQTVRHNTEDRFLKYFPEVSVT